MNKETVEIIFAQAVVEVWKERLDRGHCTLAQFQEAMIDNINRTKDAHEVLHE